MADAAKLNLLVLASFNTGEPLIRRARERGAKVWLLTKARYLNKPWPRELLEDVYAEPDDAPLAHTVKTVSYLSRKILFDRIFAFDDIDVEVAATLRGHLRIPGMDEARARLFRDKLSMRTRAAEEGIPVPAFVHVLNDAAISAFMDRIPAPWMLKPRSEAATTGIRKIHSPQQLWELVEGLGDRRSQFLLEQFLPGDVHHVDALVSEKKVVFAEVHRNGVPPFEVASGGGMFTTSTVPRGSADEKALLALNEKVLARFGLERGPTHVEYIKGGDGTFYFLEAGARVGGAHVADVVEASSGINLWREWANLEIDQGKVPYALPHRRQEYAGLLQTLARQEHPDLSAYDDPEICLKTDDPYHAGLVVRAKSHERVQALLEDYTRRFAADFHAALPPRDLPPER
jgi:hypothetical protein